MLRETYHDYIDHMTEVRTLSSPDFRDLQDSVSYGALLTKNFKRIGELATQNRSILKHELYPLIDSSGQLPDDTVRELSEFCQELIDASYVESLDAPLVSLITQRLMEDALTKSDDAEAIRQLDAQIVACYTLESMAMRITCSPQIASELRELGLQAADKLLGYLDESAFAQLDDTSRELVLTNARYAAVLFESTCPSPRINQRSLDMLDHALDLSNVAFYHDAVPDFDWDYFRFRALEYYSMSTDICNVRRFDPAQLARIDRRSEEFESLWHSDPAHYGAIAAECEVRIACARNRYLVGEIDAAAYQDELLDVYHTRDRQSFGVDGAYANLLAPLEYLLVLDPHNLNEKTCTELGSMYEDICHYAEGIAARRCLGFVLEYFSLILENFIEVPGGITFEEMGLRCLAALHPPTYVHSAVVGLITRCLTEHLVDISPELFVGICGCSTADEVVAAKQTITSFAYHAAICHDFGKLPLIDTILVYGRDLFDFEFGLIKEHPSMGAIMLSSHESTRAYADVALLHHRWYDQSRGYPDHCPASSPIKTIVDLVACADCMDAATDPVGRSYRRCKDLDAYLAEVAEGAGTRYAPYLPDLLARPEVRRDLDFVLSEGRSKNYRNAYLLLSRVQEEAVC